jgi:hypothetical protein
VVVAVIGVTAEDQKKSDRESIANSLQPFLVSSSFYIYI